MSSPRYPAIAPIKTGNSGPRRKKMNALEKITAVKSRRAMTKTARSNSFMALPRFPEPHPFCVARLRQRSRRTSRAEPEDRKSGVSGKSVSVRVDPGGSRNIKKKKKQHLNTQYNIQTMKQPITLHTTHT